jgi:hypothetical protein
MKTKQLVKVYQKPITEEEFEGEAYLQKKLDIKAPKGFEYWKVKFIGEISSYQRLIKIQ